MQFNYVNRYVSLITFSFSKPTFIFGFWTKFRFSWIYCAAATSPYIYWISRVMPYVNQESLVKVKPEKMINNSRDKVSLLMKDNDWKRMRYFYRERIGMDRKTSYKRFSWYFECRMVRYGEKITHFRYSGNERIHPLYAVKSNGYFIKNIFCSCWNW